MSCRFPAPQEPFGVPPRAPSNPVNAGVDWDGVCFDPGRHANQEEEKDGKGRGRTKRGAVRPSINDEVRLMGRYKDESSIKVKDGSKGEEGRV